MPRITIRFTKRSYNVIKLLYALRIIQNYLIIDKNGRKIITFNAFNYKNTPYFSHLKVVSSPSNVHHVSLKSLRVMSNSIGSSIIILETDKGIISHKAALSYNIGGKILAVVS